MDSSNGNDSSLPPLDDVFVLLSHKRRRYLLHCLTEIGPRVSLPDLADEVSVREHGCPLTDIPEDDVLAVYISLYHQHIPLLATAGLVQYNQERDLVRVTADVERLLQEIPDSHLDRGNDP